jgi:hypothetical protein
MACLSVCSCSCCIVICCAWPYVVLVVCTGMVVFHFLEGWTWVECAPVSRNRRPDAQAAHLLRRAPATCLLTNTRFAASHWAGPFIFASRRSSPSASETTCHVRHHAACIAPSWPPRRRTDAAACTRARRDASQALWTAADFNSCSACSAWACWRRSLARSRS